MKRIVITEFMDAVAVDRLSRGCDVHWDDNLADNRAELLRLVTGADALIVRNRTRVDHELLAAARHLKVVGRLGVGLDNIDLEACEARSVEVCPAIGANAPSVAEYVIAVAFVLVRRALRGTRRLVAGEWPRAEMSTGGELAGRVMGLIGFGGIGQEVARRAGALGMSTIACDPKLPEDHPAWTGTRRTTLDDVIATADVVSLHVPLNDETRGLIDRRRLAAMKSGAVLINTARGGIVDERALAEALGSGRLAGAALDVFDSEPPDPAAMKRFAGLDNIVLTPHIAGLTAEANRRVSEVTVDNVLKALEADT